MKIREGLSVTAAIFADDATVVGIADGPLAIASMGCFIGGLSGIYGKKTCTECGDEYYGF